MPNSGYMFSRLGEVRVNIKGSLKELRGILDAKLGSTDELRNKRYIFVDNDFDNIEQNREDHTPIENVYTSNIKVKVV